MSLIDPALLLSYRSMLDEHHLIARPARVTLLGLSLLVLNTSLTALYVGRP